MMPVPSRSLPLLPGPTMRPLSISLGSASYWTAAMDPPTASSCLEVVEGGRGFANPHLTDSRGRPLLAGSVCVRGRAAKHCSDSRDPSLKCSTVICSDVSTDPSVNLAHNAARSPGNRPEGLTPAPLVTEPESDPLVCFQDCEQRCERDSQSNTSETDHENYNTMKPKQEHQSEQKQRLVSREVVLRCGIRYHLPHHGDMPASCSIERPPGTAEGQRANLENIGLEQGSANRENPGLEQGSANPENPGLEQGSANPENPGLEQGNTNRQNPGLEQGSANPENPGLEQGSANLENIGLEQGSANPENPGLEQGSANLENPGLEQGNANRQNPGLEQGSANPENPGLEQGNANPENPGLEQGSANPENPGLEQGSANPENPGLEQGNANPENPGLEQGSANPENPGLEQGSANPENPGLEPESSNSHPSFL
ncbi:hypothetical protein P4O66_014764 [Electrophorus voltai]|uniref:Uncharacterized protein n=1 Tax=Electrophorus voltai TaxID=2609070 RepID=A0AAD8Z419_9TELE|nr:hypothetical protein P4O66_014764 [Electrophorus voltai]